MTQHTFLVLGAGMVGSVIAADLATDPDHAVIVADNSQAALDALPNTVTPLLLDLNVAGELEAALSGCSVAIGATPSKFGYSTLHRVIEAGIPYCDISFMSENALDFQDLAVARGVCAVVDCGVAPGLSNLLAGRAVKMLADCASIDIMVGGLPMSPALPFNYKAGFAPSDVLEEYTRPARLVRNGMEVVVDALTEPELVTIGGHTVEAFNTDGLRSLVYTLDVPNMVEKTLRYPGHAELMKVFRDTGLFSKTPVDVGGVPVVPLELMSALLFPLWKFEEGEGDRTLFRVRATGVQNYRQTTLCWELVDEYDPATGWRSMSRTTGFPAAIVARMLANGTLSEPGVHPPEVLGASESLTAEILKQLGDRGVQVKFSQR